MSQPILFRSLKYDGSLNYEWQAQVEYQYANLAILLATEGTAYRGRSSGVLRFPMRTYLWTDRWFNLNQIYAHAEGRGVRHYVNIGTPAVLDGAVASTVDLDLDLDVDCDWGVRLLDEDEYAAHSAQFGYPAHVMQSAAQGLHAAEEKIRARAWPFATSVDSARTRVRPFFWNDLEQMDRWRGAFSPFDDPWLIPAAGSRDRMEWYAHYIETPVTRLYAIETLGEQAMIGHISLRDMTPRVEARLGIGLAPERVGMGYGTEALRAFLDYYFGVLDFQRMVLDVAATNERAIRSYQRLGFRTTGEHHRGYGADAQWRVLDKPENSRFRKFFRQTAWGVQQLFYDMEMTSEMWQAIRRATVASP